MQTPADTPTVERLDPADREQVIEALADAFADHPMFPDPRPGLSHRMCSTMINTFADADDAVFFGIRDGDQLACVAFAYTDGYNPGALAMVGMFWRMLRIFGLGMMRRMMRVMKEMDAHRKADKTRRLELLFLGTRQAHQQRGYGRVMLEHIRQYATEQGYDAVVLEAPKNTPARKLYESQGFRTKLELQMPTMPLVLMRQELTDVPAGQSMGRSIHPRRRCCLRRARREPIDSKAAVAGSGIGAAILKPKWLFPRSWKSEALA
jgi:ribosomal protein S18 acetylase RimI-like enzyme